jgi:hypothetical protein
VSEANGSFSHLNLYVGSDWRVRCIISAAQPPMLAVEAGGTGVSLCLASREIRPSEVEFAAELARETARFADEVKRRYADQQAAQEDKPADAAA